MTESQKQRPPLTPNEKLKLYLKKPPKDLRTAIPLLTKQPPKDSEYEIEAARLSRQPYRRKILPISLRPSKENPPERKE